MEHRKDARLPVQFRSSFSSANLVSGHGALHNLSIRGCRVSSLIDVKPGAVLQLRIVTADETVPIQVSQAVVRWCQTGSFGCEFVNLSPDDWERLQYVIRELEMHPFQRHDKDTEAA